MLYNTSIYSSFHSFHRLIEEKYKHTTIGDGDPNIIMMTWIFPLGNLQSTEGQGGDQLCIQISIMQWTHSKCQGKVINKEPKNFTWEEHWL